MTRKDDERDALFELLDQAGKLQQKRGRVMEATINALRLGKQRSLEVDRWLVEVEKVLREVNELEGLYADRRKTLCERILGLRFGSKMAVKLRETIARINSIMGEPKRDSSHALAAEKSRLIPREKGIVGLESAFNKVWSFIADGKVGIIGIQGPGGVGKTTLLKQVHNALMDKILDFDLIIRVQVPRLASLKKVQDKICETLGLLDRLQGSDDEERRASAIFNALRSKRFVLMLDDLWEPLSLEKIGVPHAGLHQSKSKIIFTTRFLPVCDGMEADKTYSLQALSHEDARYLLVKVVGDDIFDQNSFLFSFCPRIIQACGNLPYAIVTVGRALRGRRCEEEWEGVLNQLRRASPRADMGVDKQYWFAPLKLAYESLSSRAKQCFLYCFLLPEGHRIDKDQLVDYWIGEGFMEEIKGRWKDRRCEGYGIIEKLIDAYLLEREGNFITLNPLVREMEWEIASEGREEGKYFVKAGVDLQEVPIDKIAREATKISLMQNYLTKLPPSPQWPKVSTLLLSGNEFEEIPGDFFSGMRSLQVLDLSNSGIEELPATISVLERLQYLNLSRTKLRSLCLQLQTLVKLEILYLSYIDGLNFVPSNLFVKLVSLQLLSMDHCGHQGWMHEDEKTETGDLLVGGEAFLKELESLSRLENLEISINGDAALKKFESSVKLQNCVNIVSIGGCETPTVSALKFQNLRILEVSSCPNLLRFEIDWLGKEAMTSTGILEHAFNNLQHVRINYCWSLEELSWLCYASNLQTLHVEECINLKEVIASHGDLVEEAINGTFLSLKKLYLNNLPSLKSISELPLPSHSLEEISVSYCPMLKKLPVNSDNANRALQVIKGEAQWYHALQWDDDETKNSFHPYFLPI